MIVLLVSSRIMMAQISMRTHANVIILILVAAQRVAATRYDSGRPKQILAAIQFNLGPIRGMLNVGTDIPLGYFRTARDLEQLRANLRIPADRAHQLQMITRDLLEAFGLYEPFRRQIKSVVLNNPVYYGVKSGMVNYSKNMYGFVPRGNDTAPGEGFKWDGVNDGVDKAPTEEETQHLSQLVTDAN